MFPLLPVSLKRFLLLPIALLLSSPLFSQQSGQPSLLLLSIDGLKPEAVLEAEARGLKLPNLRALVRDGAFAQGVTGVLPTLTYPSHTTLLTGASPARHDIIANTTFDPLNQNQQGWYWYAEDIQVPTLWDAAHAAHLSTANIYWPVSIGAASIDFNLPQIWRANTPDDLKLQRALSTSGLESALVKDLGRYPGGEEETVEADEIRTRFAVRLLETRHPVFFTVYLTGLDTEQHASGPFSVKANSVLERQDALVGKLRAAAERNNPGHAFFAVVSDHGFAPVEHDVNLYAAFLAEGFLKLNADHKLVDWTASPWPAGGSAGVMLKNQNDAATRAQVAAMLQRLAADPASGIDQVLSGDQARQQGGFPAAAFFVSFKIGYELGYKFTPPLVSEPTNLGMHGYLPANPQMRSSFFLVGPGIRPGTGLGQIDMRRIAPTLAATLHLILPAAELPALAIAAK